MTLKQIKKLDAESLKNLEEGEGPCDICICGLLKEPRETGITASMRRCARCFTQVFSGKSKKDQGSDKGSKGKGAAAKKGAKGKKPPPGKKGAKDQAGKGAKGGKGSSSSSQSSKDSVKSNKSAKCPK